MIWSASCPVRPPKPKMGVSSSKAKKVQGIGSHATIPICTYRIALWLHNRVSLFGDFIFFPFYCIFCMYSTQNYVLFSVFSSILSLEGNKKGLTKNLEKARHDFRDTSFTNTLAKKLSKLRKNLVPFYVLKIARHVFNASFYLPNMHFNIDIP